MAIAKVQTRTFHTVNLIEVTGSKCVHFLFIDKFDFHCLAVRTMHVIAHFEFNGACFGNLDLCSSIYPGMWAHRMTCLDYQDLIDRGWRR